MVQRMIAAKRIGSDLARRWSPQWSLARLIVDGRRREAEHQAQPLDLVDHAERKVYLVLGDLAAVVHSVKEFAARINEPC